MLNAALTYAKKGIAVFPCAVGGKLPLTEHGCKDACTDANQITEWWRAEPQANIGVATGKASNIFAVDVDGFDGECELRRLEREHAAALPSTVESITGRGRHLFFKMPLDTDVRNSAGKLGDGLDVRGSGGFCILPPSIHPSGRRYEWSVDSASAFAEAPQWLLDTISARAAKPATPADWCALVSNPIPEGKRDTSLARLAGHLLRRYVDPFVVLGLVQAVNAHRCTPPLGEDDVVRIVELDCRH